MTAGKPHRRVLVVGGTNFDIIVRSERLPRDHEKLRGGEYSAEPGGSAANTAMGLAHQGCAVWLVSTVGDDALGTVCLDSLRAGGVRTTLMKVDRHARTSMAIVLSAGKGKRMMTFAGADRNLAFDAVQERHVREADHLHVVGEPSPALSRLVALAGETQRSVSVEWNGRDMSSLAPRDSLNFMNADEADRLPDAVPGDTAGTALRLARRLSADVIVTVGSEGALWAARSGDLFRASTVPEEPVDRTGGGDAFDAGVLAAWLSGEAPVTCMSRGLDAALRVIMKVGGHP
ncbi:carbohydrate kinase family protein [Streptomyces sp. B6B3]|uniref:carbohydrate kinase family protein n=1 Tax=Streptomyces sp. B6B3 TaxID=3153570 RepID=UPI00325EA786